MFVLLNLIIAAASALTVVLALSWGRREAAFGMIPLFLGYVTASSLLALICWLAGSPSIESREILNYKIVTIRHTEEWTEKERREKEVPCGTRKRTVRNSKGERRVVEETVYKTVVYYVTEHYGPYWHAFDEYGNKIGIERSEYDKWAGIWNNAKVVKTHNGTAAGFDQPITGKVYECEWDRSVDKIYPTHSIHMYVNKVRATRNVWSTAEPSKEDSERFVSPADKGDACPIVSYDSSGALFDDAEKLTLERWNCVWGPERQIHVMLVVFDSKNGSISDVARVLNVWKGPNKNELCVFMGLDPDRKVVWAQTVSWMDDTTLHALIDGHILGRRLDVGEFVGFLNGNMRYWKRKQFSDFDYIVVSMGGMSKIIDLVLQIVLFMVFVGIGVNVSGRHYC